MRLSPRSPDLDVAQHALQIAHAGGERLHLAQPLMHLLQAVAHQFEGFAKALLQRALQLLVHGLPHQLQLVGILISQRGEVDGKGLAKLLQGRRIGFGQAVHAGDHLLQFQALRVGGFLRTGP